MNQEQKKIDIVLYSESIKRRLRFRFEALRLKPSDVVKDANEKGMTTITKDKLSRYLNNDVPVRGFPTQKDILWLCTRYGLEVKLNITLIPNYIEAECIERAKNIMNA